MTGPRLTADDAARERAAGDLDTSFLVEASAGTGKTSLLVDRVIAILRSRRASLREIVAITFTEKAAGELRLRIRRRLEEPGVAATLPPGTAEHALADIGVAPIMTIHAFAQSLLRERPVEAKLDPGSRVADETVSRALLLDTWREWVESAFAQPDDALAGALAAGIDAAALERLARLASNNRDILQEYALCETGPQGADADAGAASAVRAFYQRLPEYLRGCDDPGDLARRAMVELMESWNDLSTLSDVDLLARLEQEPLPSPKKGNRSKWRRPDVLERYRQDLTAVRERVEGRVAVRRHRLIRALLQRMSEFLDFYRDRRRDRCLLDFTDLLLEARDLLSENREVRGYFQKRFRFILVDEFQDTDPLQAEMVFFLAERAPAAARWQDVVLEPGKLFLVGDPKQSIYRFRRADIEVYELARECVAQQPDERGNVLYLSRNFRSSRPVIDWVNHAFGQLIEPLPGERLQPAYRPLETCEFTADSPGAVRVLEPAEVLDRAPPVAELAAIEGKLLAGAIEGLIARGERIQHVNHAEPRPTSYGDVAVLIRGFTHIARYTGALAERDIPYRVIGGRSFYEREETHALISILRAIENPRDRASLVAALRSPAFGVSDEELFVACSTGALETGSATDAVGRAIALITSLHRDRNRGSLGVFVERVVRETGLVPLVHLQPEGERRTANIEKIIAMARERDREGDVALGRFAGDLAELMEDVADEPDSGSHDDGADAVRIITVHRAKGLEFPVVFLVNLWGEFAAPALYPRLRALRGRRQYALALSNGFASAEYDALDQHESRANECEARRLLYVAATRARNILYIVHPGTAGEKRALGMLTPLLPPDRETDALHPPAPAIEIAALPRPDVPVPMNDLDAFDRTENAWRARLERARRHTEPCFRIVQPSSFEAEPARPGEGWSGSQGTTVGRLVHEFLASALHQDEPSILDAFERRIRHDELVPAEATRARSLLKRALSSSILARARRSVRKLSEVPFIVPAETGAAGEGADPIPLFVEGRIDLLFEENGRITLVDFKTERSEPLLLDLHARQYHAAMDAYARATEMTTGLPVDACLYFLDPDVVVPIVRDPKAGTA